MSISDELEKLNQLRSQGALSEAEFQEAKARVIQSDRDLPRSVRSDEIFGMKPETWCMAMHLSQLLYVFGGVGFIAPIVMWLISKDHNAQADRHGAAILNWLLTSFIALTISGILLFFIIGIPFFIIYLLLIHIFPIIGAIKAADGEFWEYPTSIRFIKFDDQVHDYGEYRESYF